MQAPAHPPGSTAHSHTGLLSPAGCLPQVVPPAGQGVGPRRLEARGPQGAPGRLAASQEAPPPAASGLPPRPGDPQTRGVRFPRPRSHSPREFPETRFHRGERFLLPALSEFPCERSVISVLPRERAVCPSRPGWDAEGRPAGNPTRGLPEVSARSRFTRRPPDAGKDVGAWAVGVGQAQVGCPGSRRSRVSLRPVTSTLGGDTSLAGSPRAPPPGPTAGL